MLEVKYPTSLESAVEDIIKYFEVEMVTQSTDIEMKEDLEFSDEKEEAAYWRQMAEEYVQK